MKFYHKYLNNKLPVYLQNMPFIYISAIHDHNTRQKDNIYTNLVKHSFAKNCLRYSIPCLINSLPKIVSDKLYTHSYDSFKIYVKNQFIQGYPELCHIESCYVCNRNGV